MVACAAGLRRVHKLRANVWSSSSGSELQRASVSRLRESGKLTKGAPALPAFRESLGQVNSKGHCAVMKKRSFRASLRNPFRKAHREATVFR